MREADFQRNLKKEIKQRFPGCVVMKNDPNDIQGIPDLSILYKDRWAMLECKANSKSKYRPNQERKISQLNEMSFCRTITPENKEEVLDDMEQSFQRRRGR